MSAMRTCLVLCGESLPDPREVLTRMLESGLLGCPVILGPRGSWHGATIGGIRVFEVPVQPRQLEPAAVVHFGQELRRPARAALRFVGPMNELEAWELVICSIAPLVAERAAGIVVRGSRLLHVAGDLERARRDAEDRRLALGSRMHAPSAPQAPAA